MGTTLARDGAAFLSQLMFYSASISASKRVPSTGSTYALRVNPSSGNLHPTEFHSALATTNRYVHLSQNHLADAQKRIEAYRQEKAFAEAQEAAPLSKQTT